MKRTHARIMVAVAPLVLLSTVWTAVAQEPTGTRPAVTGAAVDASETPEGCRLEKLTVPSTAMKRNIRAWVVLPPRYGADSTKRYPVLYTLHGRGAPYTTWSDMGPLRRALAQMPMILVGFDGDRASWYLDAKDDPKSQFRTFFFSELVPFIGRTYRTTGRKAVTGFSMGGFGALYYMLGKPQEFVSVSGLSSALPVLPEDGSAPTGFAKDIVALLGQTPDGDGFDGDIFAFFRKRVEGGAKLPPMMLRCGVQDRLLTDNRAFADLLRTLDAAGKKIELDYGESDGAHDWKYWVGQSRAVAEFHWTCFEEDRTRGAK